MSSSSIVMSGPSNHEMLSGHDSAQQLYLDLLKRVLTRTVVHEHYLPLGGPNGPCKQIYKLLYPIVKQILRTKGLELVRSYKADWSKREQGLDYPPEAETMVGLKRLDNVQACVTDILRSGVPGDLIETGVWRGGCSIFMKAILAAYGDITRNVWLADSFEGLPKPNAEEYPADQLDLHWTASFLAVPLETVQNNFRRYGLLDDRVRFLKGWFKDTIARVPIERLAVMRLDGDMYESTIQVLDALYPKLSIGGFAIIDDYNLRGCKAAVDDFRKAHDINDEMFPADSSAVYWKRLS